MILLTEEDSRLQMKILMKRESQGLYLVEVELLENLLRNGEKEINKYLRVIFPMKK